jgi:Protein of unknown function (DUF3485)
MSRYLLLLTVAVVVLADGYLCGHWTGRWHETQAPEVAARLQQLPLTVGDWQGETQELDRRVVQRAGFSGYVSRIYRNQRGVEVSLLIGWGPPGPLSVHTPEVCYGASGFAMTNAVERCTPYKAGSSTTGEFWRSTFTSRTTGSIDRRRVIWSWNKNGIWQAPDNPRWTLAGTPVLYKLYATQQFLPVSDAADGHEVEDFLREFLPEVDRALAQDS